MDSIVRLALLHRSRLFRQCLTSVLGNEARFRVLDLDHESEDFETTLSSERFDVLLIDVHLRGDRTIELIQHVRKQADAKVIVLVNLAAAEKVVECVAAGADACILEESSLDDLREAITSVAADKPFCSKDILHSLFTQVRRLAQESRWRQRVETAGLTQRETEVLHFLAEELSNKEIAKRLCVSLHTVKNHVHNILEKLDVESRFEAAEYARQRQWLSRL